MMYKFRGGIENEYDSGHINYNGTDEIDQLQLIFHNIS